MLIVFLCLSFFCKAKAPFKVKAYVWTMVVNTINTNDVRHIWRPNKTLSLDIRVMCYKSSETNNHIFCVLRSGLADLE